MRKLEYAKPMRILVTGGAGYIGSHVVRLAQESGHSVHVIDNLSTGVSKRVEAPTTRLDLTSSTATAELTDLLKTGFDAVIHFAALKQVGQSVAEPERYYQANIGGMANLLTAMRLTETKRLVFSSSAAVYGTPAVDLVSENTAKQPINPYGETKLIGEWMVSNAKVWGLRGVNLRYFNVAGTGWADLADTAALNLIPMAIQKIEGGTNPIVFGTDYPTADGSCIRDYVHVADLARAHLMAISYLDKPGERYASFNVGSGVGSSVLEVLSTLKSVSGGEWQPEIQARRPGDPPKLVADVALIGQEMGFAVEHDLQSIVSSAWASRQK